MSQVHRRAGGERARTEPPSRQRTPAAATGLSQLQLWAGRAQRLMYNVFAAHDRERVEVFGAIRPHDDDADAAYAPGSRKTWSTSSTSAGYGSSRWRP